MKKTLWVILLIIFVFLIFLVVWRRRGIRSERWQRVRQEAPATQTTPSPATEEVSPEGAAVEKDLEDIDQIMESLDPQKDFQDIPDKELGF